MATGSGKTFTAITSVYRLLKHADAKRILFLVDTKNLGEQAEQEFMSYVPNDDNRKFTELYNVQRLKSSFIAGSSQVCISTIQRMYSILKDEPLDESAEEDNPAERLVRPKEPLPVVYNKKIPPEFFDFIIIDECHRSIYNLWRQVIEYFDAYLIGLTATPDNRTYGFFHKNVVSEYGHEQAVADGVNVGNEIYVIETEVTKQGATDQGRAAGRKARAPDPQEALGAAGRGRGTTPATQLDRAVVNPDQIRTVIRTFRDKLPEIFPGREEVPKTLIFAKTDSHADDIIQIVREEFGAGQRLLQEDHLPGERRPEIRPRAVPQRLQPAHRRDGGHDRHRHRREAARMSSANSTSSGSAELDALLGGGLERGTSALLIGGAGVGKSSIAVTYAVAAAERGEQVAMFAFDEGLGTLFARASSLGVPLRDHVNEGRVRVQQIDPAEMSPGEFTHMVRDAVKSEGARVLIIDSLNGFLNAMPDERFLVLQMH